MDCFIICSKNVSILCRNEEDISLYKDKRNAFSNIIAESWFKFYNLSTKKEQIKELLENHTLVGEYTGHPDHQHLVKYF